MNSIFQVNILKNFKKNVYQYVYPHYYKLDKCKLNEILKLYVIIIVRVKD